MKISESYLRSVQVFNFSIDPILFFIKYSLFYCMPFCCGFPSVAMHYYELYNVVTSSLAKSIRIIIHLIVHADLSAELIWHESSDGEPRLAPRSSDSSGIVCPSQPACSSAVATAILRCAHSRSIGRQAAAAVIGSELRLKLLPENLRNNLLVDPRSGRRTLPLQTGLCSSLRESRWK